MKVTLAHLWKRGALALGFALSVLALPVAQAQGSAPATVAGTSGYGVPIPGQYIVVFKPNVHDSETLARSMAYSARGELRHVYTHAIKGFAASLPEAALNGIRNHPNVAYIEQDATVGINQTTQTDPPSWGLDRIDQSVSQFDRAYNYNTTASNVTAYIIDTGIYAGHADFGERVKTGKGFVSSGKGRSATTDPSTDDCNGHGTHVAGTVGGGQYGVAKAVDLVPVRVLDCKGSGSTSGVIAGIDWVAQNAVSPAVANMSLGGGASSSLDSALAGAVQAGVVMVVAAGNDNADACNYSPARAPSAITVGATGHRVSVNGVTRIDQYDGRADYSNYGNCLDLFAPGSLITSAWIGGEVATNTISGTSMAAPHVTGVAALVLSAYPTASPAAIENFLATTGTADVVTSSQSPGHNNLLYSLATGTPTAPTGGTGTGSGPTDVAISGLTGASNTNFVNGWKAIARITVGVVNSDGSLGDGYPGATVSVSFTPGGSASCTTGSDGRCDATSGGIKKNVSSVTATVTGVTGTGTNYVSGKNTETSITINP